MKGDWWFRVWFVFGWAAVEGSVKVGKLVTDVEATRKKELGVVLRFKSNFCLLD